MAKTVASKFAVLRVDDDENWQTMKQTKNEIKNKPEVVTMQKEVVSTKKKNQKRKELKSETEQLKSLAFGGPSKSKSKNGGAGDMPMGVPPLRNGMKKDGMTKEHWQEWKDRDSEFVTESYQQDMQEALLLSKLDFEEKKDFYGQMEQEVKEKQAEEKSKNKKKKEKKNKAQTMSLGQFNNTGPNGDLKESTPHSFTEPVPLTKGPKVVNEDKEFFERIVKDAKTEISKEEIKERRKKRDEFIPEIIKMAKYEDEIKAKDKEIVSLKDVIANLKEELQNVKTRNKKLCGILGQGESKAMKTAFLIKLSLQQYILNN